MTTRFDRLRPRAPDAAPLPALDGEPVRDRNGKRTLFTSAPSPPAFGAVAIDCSRCGRRSVVGLSAGVRAALPSLYLPLLRRHPWWLRCPACSRRTWTRLSLRL